MRAHVLALDIIEVEISWSYNVFIFFFQAEDGIRDKLVTGVQTCALPILVADSGEDGPAGFGGQHLRRKDSREIPREIFDEKIGRAACRGRGENLVVAVFFKKKKNTLTT